MAVTLKGLAVVWGCGNLTMTGVAISSTTGKMQNYDFTRTSETAKLADPNGEHAGRAFFDASRALNITVIPSDSAAIATATTNMLAMLPAPGTEVTVADSDGASTIIENSNGGVYMCETATLNATNDGPRSISMNLVQYESFNAAASIS